MSCEQNGNFRELNALSFFLYVLLHISYFIERTVLVSFYLNFGSVLLHVVSMFEVVLVQCNMISSSCLNGFS
jgi:hypothetical protein